MDEIFRPSTRLLSIKGIQVGPSESVVRKSVVFQIPPVAAAR